MFFGKLFKKDHLHYLNQGKKHLAAERYADARIDFLEALKLCPAGAAQDGEEIRAGVARASDSLGELNLGEAERLLLGGDPAKARVHFNLAAELAAEQSIRDRALAGLARLQSSASEAPPPAPEPKAHGGSSCAGCKDVGSHRAAAEELPDDPNLSAEDRFSLLVQPLPGELPRRYAELGRDFATAYLLIHDGRDNEAFPILQEILVSGENDIVIYEVALIMYRSGRLHECEAELNRGLRINPANPMCYLALVQLLAEAQRFEDALATVGLMMERGVLADQAQFMLGELHEAAGDQEAALAAWSKALEHPGVARSAAERLVPLLGAQGRTEEATYLVKRYLKGCC